MWRSPLERCRLHWRGLWTWSKRKYLKFVEYFKLNILNINCTGEAWEPEIREEILSLPEILNNLAIGKILLLVGSSSIRVSPWLTSMQSDWPLNIQTGDNWRRLRAGYEMVMWGNLRVLRVWAFFYFFQNLPEFPFSTRHFLCSSFFALGKGQLGKFIDS